MIRYIVSILSLILTLQVFCQNPAGTLLWHKKQRSIRYQPDGEDFVIVNGTRRFNRALYGTNTGFRVEAGDLPEFALYMPRMGGNFQFGLILEDSSKWLINAGHIKARYRPGSMLYEIKDSMLGDNGILYIAVLASADREAMIIEVTCKNIDSHNLKLFWAFGGASGKRFSRDGDIGADPESSFYLKPEYCNDNAYIIRDNTFTLYYGSGTAPTNADLSNILTSPGNKVNKNALLEKQKVIAGIFPPGAILKISDAHHQDSPLAFFNSQQSSAPALTGQVDAGNNQPLYFFIENSPGEQPVTEYNTIPILLSQAEEARTRLAQRVKLTTPDPYLNTLGGALAIAADAIWEDPTYLHGAVAWRMRLNAWRGAYAADMLGWHDRARKHFSSYALSQLTSPETGPLAPDTALHFARHQEKIGTAMFTSGYICRNPNGDFRAHHYDMNLVFIDQLLTHFFVTGDKQFIREMWPVIRRHLAWEKRNFDSDGDGLYDAYCCIWASDALQYSNGGVTHSSSYNYRANKLAAELALIVQEDPEPYRKEAEKIFQAIEKYLWLPDVGWYAEYRDFSGNKLAHPAAGVWTVYHAIDSRVPDPFKAYQTLRYVDTNIPRIPINIKGFPEGNHYLVSTTNWMPYTWSINNVALAEVLHTALAYWQGGRPEEAFNLWRSALLESMYAGASPGSFQQLSFYDAMRGELYRDFADPIGMASRTLVEGLFGIFPDALHDTLTIRPGLPEFWSFASLHLPDISVDFKREENKDIYSFTPSFPAAMNLKLVAKARRESIKTVLVNGQKATWNVLKETVGSPAIEIVSPAAAAYQIEIIWQGNKPEAPLYPSKVVNRQRFAAQFKNAVILNVFDPQQALEKNIINKKIFNAHVKAGQGDKTVFVNVRQGQLTWWVPLCFRITEAIEIISPPQQEANALNFQMKSNAGDVNGTLVVNSGKRKYTRRISLPEDSVMEFVIPATSILSGSNIVRFESSGGKTAMEKHVINWNVKNAENTNYIPLKIVAYYNDKVTNIFKNKYLSPRPASPTLQLPWQGIGNWCYPLTDVTIDDSGLRALAGNRNEIRLPNGIPFSTPGAGGQNNIVFTSQWDNYPDSVVIPVNEQGSHIYFLMAGSTNPMQSQFVNGIIKVYYEDGSCSSLALRNPETWWPIEQDYFTDGFAFTLRQPKPIRVHLKSGLITRDFNEYKSIKDFSNFGIDGGAATVLDLPLDPLKKMKSLVLKSIANDVVVGLMSATIVR